jgi:hypothetical protein
VASSSRDRALSQLATLLLLPGEADTGLVVFQDYGEKVAKVRQAQKSFADDKERGFEAKVRSFFSLPLMLDTAASLTTSKLRICRWSKIRFAYSFCSSSSSKRPPPRAVHSSVSALTRRYGNACSRAWTRRPIRRDQISRSPTNGAHLVYLCSLRALGNNLTRFGAGICDLDRFWYIKLRALVALRDWDALDTFARSKKSPIGYEPWVDELIRAGAHRQAVRYVDRCDPRNRVELYIKCGEWVMAGQECVRRGERGRLQCVFLSFCFCSPFCLGGQVRR